MGATRLPRLERSREEALADTVMCGDGVARRASDLVGKSHREAYPEQYTHPMVGKPVTLQGAMWGQVERVVATRFGPVAIFSDGSGQHVRYLETVPTVEHEGWTYWRDEDGWMGSPTLEDGSFDFADGTYVEDFDLEPAEVEEAQAQLDRLAAAEGF